MGGKPVAPLVLSYLSERPGKSVTLQRMAADLRLGEKQVQQATSNMIRTGDGLSDRIEVLQRGQAWRYTAPVDEPPEGQALAVGDMLEVVGIARSGEAVARDGNDNLYRVVAL